MHRLARLLQESDVPERERFDRDTAHMLDRLASRLSAVQRYRMARHYVRGRVADAASGCGYGSWILSRCPAVTAVAGYERDLESVAFARSEYGEGPVFHVADLCSISFGVTLACERPDTVVSLETIEHLPEPEAFVCSVLRSGASRFIVSFPSFETVTFNPYHLRDFTPEEVSAMVGREPCRQMLVDDAVWVQVYDL